MRQQGLQVWLFITRFSQVNWLAFKLAFLQSGRPEVRFKLFFERAGGGFIKLGQILALRYDLLPPAYTQELLKLLSSVQTVPFSELEPILIAELGSKLEQYFSRFQRDPIASASISQVYRATLRTGEEVVVKIKRPGVDQIFATDFALANFLAGLVGLFKISRSLNLEEAVAEFVVWTRRELDFNFEAKNAEVLRAHSHRHPNTVIPKVYPELSSSRVLIMEYMPHIYRLDNVINGLEKNPNLRADLLQQQRLDLSQMAYYFIFDGMRQYFIDGFFHADPHPANVFFMADNRLGYFDFGIMGEVDSRRLELLKIVYGIANHDLKAVSQAFLSYSKRSLNEEIEIFRHHRKQDFVKYERILAKIEEIITENFREELEEILAPWYEPDPTAPPYAASASVIFSKLLFRAQSYSVYVPREMVIFFRSLIIADMVAIKLEPEFSMIKALKLFFREYPLIKAEEIIMAKSHERELSAELDPVLNLEYEELMELKQLERERLSLAAERLSDLILYYAENYEEIRKML